MRMTVLHLGLAVAFLMGAAAARGDAPQSAPADATPVSAETGSDGVQRLSITLDSYSYTPSHIVVEAGKPVEFELKNVASTAPHDFKIDAGALGPEIKQDVKAGKTATLRFTPTVPGTYQFYCDKKLPFLPSHKDKGMVGTLDVH